MKAVSPYHLDQVRELFREYAASTGVELCFRNFNEELGTLPGEYVPPSGCIFLAEWNGQVAGCVALRKIGSRICEMKRLYVRPQFRRKGIGRRLVDAAIKEAGTLGYTIVRLYTVPSMREAISLYKSTGFSVIEPVECGCLKGVICMELRLNGF